MLKYLNADLINIYDIENTNKEDIIKKMILNLKNHSDLVIDSDIFYNEIMEREKIGTTGIGMGVAIPHARCEALKGLVVSCGILKKGIDFQSLDGEKVNIVVLVGAPKGENKQYLEFLSSLSRLFREKKIRDRILNANTKDEVLSILSEKIC